MTTKSRFSKKLSWPHPLVKHSSINLHYANDYYEDLPPSTFQPFESSEQSSHKPCPHIFRTSAYILGSTPELNSNLQVGCIVSPFNTCSIKIQQSSIQKTMRCCNCQVFITPDWIEEKSNRFYCKLCDHLFSNGIENSLMSNTTSAVQDIILQKSQDYKRKILFVIEASSNTRNSEFFEHMLHNIELLKQEDTGYRTQVGFIVYDERVNIISKTKNSFQIVKLSDYYEDEFPVSMRSMLFDTQSDLREVYEILDDLIQPDENTDRRPKFNYYQILKLFASEIDPYTQVNLIASNFKIPIDNRDPKAQINQINKLNQLSNQYLDKNIVLNLFSLSKDRKCVEQINRIIQKTGGISNVHILNRQYHPQDFYYDLYQYLHGQHYYDISIKVTASNNFICSQLNNKVFEQKDEKLLKLSKLPEHSNFNLFLKIKSNISKALLNIQIQYKHRGVTKLRVINYQYLISNRLSEIYSYLGDQCLFYLALRRSIYSKPNMKLSEICISMISAFKRMLKECRTIWENTSSFSIPNCLKYSIFYCESMVKHIRGISDKQSLYLMNQSLYNWKHENLERLSKMISMKLYRIDKEDQPINNIKYYYYNIEEDGIYAIDNGKYIYFYIGENVSPAIVEDHLVIEHDVKIVGARLNQFVYNLRNHNTSGYLQLKNINQLHKQIVLDGLFIQDTFKRFVKNLCEM